MVESGDALIPHCLQSGCHLRSAAKKTIPGRRLDQRCRGLRLSSVDELEETCYFILADGFSISLGRTRVQTVHKSLQVTMKIHGWLLEKVSFTLYHGVSGSSVFALGFQPGTPRPMSVVPNLRFSGQAVA